MTDSPTHRVTSANPLFLAAGASLVALVLLVLLLGKGSQRAASSGNKQTELFVFCAAGMRVPIEQIARQYEEEYGVSIRIQYGGSNSLLSQIEIGKTGDLYLAADESYLEIAKQKSLVDETFRIASMHPVIIAPSTNKKKIAELADLTRADVRISLADPDQAAVGKLVRASLQAEGQWEALATAARTSGVFKPTVNEVANDVLIGAVDAGIVWDAVAAQHDQLVVVPSEKLSEQSVLIGVGVLRSSKLAQEALRFARYLSAKDRGLPAFAEHGYQPIEGDRWSESPQLTLFAGAVNRLALEPIVEAFEQRHGVDISTVYNGCGILTAQMQSIEEKSLSGFPDVYMACDTYYMDTVSPLFENKLNVSDTPIVIAVQSGNPKSISSLSDLNKPGMRVALGQPEQCTIGVLSRRLLESAGIYEAILEENIVTQTATSSLLIPSVATGSADAALVYQTDARAERDRVDMVAIESPLAKAVQPIGTATSSEQKQLSRLLFEKVTAAQETFEAAGFQWRLEPVNQIN